MYRILQYTTKNEKLHFMFVYYVVVWIFLITLRWFIKSSTNFIIHFCISPGQKKMFVAHTLTMRQKKIITRSRTFLILSQFFVLTQYYIIFFVSHAPSTVTLCVVSIPSPSHLDVTL